MSALFDAGGGWGGQGLAVDGSPGAVSGGWRHGGVRRLSVGVAGILLVMAAPGAAAWYADYEIDLENFFREPSFERFRADDLSSGYVWAGRGWHPAVPSVRFVHFATRFEPDGEMAWSAAWDPNIPTEVGEIVTHRRFLAAGRFDDVLAAYVVNAQEKPERVHLGLFNARMLQERYRLALDLIDHGMGANALVKIDVFPNSVTAVGQSHEGILKMVLIDEEGDVLLDRFYDHDFSFMPPGVPLPVDYDWRAMPDGSGYQVLLGNILTRLDSSGDVVWSKRSGLFSERHYFAPDGSVVFHTTIPGEFMDPPVPNSVTVVGRVDEDGGLAWTARIDDFRPVEGRSAVLNHGSLLFLGYPDREDGMFSPPYWDACKVVLLDASTGGVQGQAQLSVDGGRVAFPGVGGWTGEHAVVSFESDSLAHLVKLAPDFQTAETRDLSLSGAFNHGILPLLNLFYDPDEATFFYSGLLQRSVGEIERTFAVLMDDELDDSAECAVFMPGEVIVTQGEWVTPFEIALMFEDADVTISNAETPFVAAHDIQIQSFPVVVTDPCGAMPPVVTYLAWAEVIFGTEDAGDSAISGPGVDLTGDGLTNVEAYVFGLDPRVNNDPRAGVVVSEENEHLTLTFRRRANPVGYEVVVEGAYELGDWTAPVVTQNGPVDEQGMVTVTAHLEDPVSASRSGYLRVMIRGN